MTYVPPPPAGEMKCTLVYTPCLLELESYTACTAMLYIIGLNENIHGGANSFSS